MPYAYDCFYRSDKVRSASSRKSGLGLAIGKALVAAHGGTIAAGSARKDQGTTMNITLDPAPASL